VIDPRPRAGINWLSEAAKAGDRQAQAYLGNVWTTGIGRRTIPSSLGKAEKWLTAAADHGYPEDQYNLAQLYFGQQNYARTLPPLSKAVEQDFPKANLLLAQMHREGLGVPVKPAESVRLLRVSAGSGDPASQNALGEALTRGVGVEKDEKAGFDFFEKSAMGGYHDGQYNLALAYLDGVGVERDKMMGHAWLRVCIRQAFREAVKERGRRRGDLTQQEKLDVREIEEELVSQLPPLMSVHDLWKVTF